MVIIKAKNKTETVNQKKSVDIINMIMKGNWWLWIVAFISVIGSTLASYASPLIISFTLDEVLEQVPLNAPDFIKDVFDNFKNAFGGADVLLKNLWICSIAIIILAIINSIFNFIKGRCTGEVAERISENLRNTLYNHIQHLDYEYHLNAKTGDLLQRATSDVNLVRVFFGLQFIEICTILFSSLLGMSIMFSINKKLTVVSFILVPFIFIFTAVYYKKIQKSWSEINKAESKLSTTIQESLSGIRVVRAFGEQKQELLKFDEKNITYKNSIIKSNVMSAFFWGGGDVIIGFQFVIVVTACTLLALRGEITIGNMIMFLSYTHMLLWPLRNLGRLIGDFSKSKVALGRIEEILNLKKENLDGIEPENVRGEIEFRNVSFKYNKDKIILKDISFKVKSGQTISILGETGSGKSTMMYLLQRLYKPVSGDIFIDGINIKEYKLKWLRENVGLILQEPFLYSRNLKSNIIISKPNITHEKIDEVVRVSALNSVVDEFENGFDTEVGERGVTLSGGQKQRVAIARTLIKDSPILIFDDSLSALDTETDKTIRDSLKERENNATTFIISHRIITLSEADLILVIDGGKIIQRGTHEQLAKEEGLYKRVWEIQKAEDNSNNNNNNN